MANKLWWEFWPEQSAADELDGSLGRMGLDHIDLIYTMQPPEGLSIADLVAEVAGLVASGRARAWGVGNWTAEALDRSRRRGAIPRRPAARCGTTAVQPGSPRLGAGPTDGGGVGRRRHRSGRVVCAGRRNTHGQVPVGWIRTRRCRREPAPRSPASSGPRRRRAGPRVGRHAGEPGVRASPSTTRVCASVLFGATSPAASCWRTSTRWTCTSRSTRTSVPGSRNWRLRR